LRCQSNQSLGRQHLSKSIKNWDTIWPGVGPPLIERYNHTHLQKHCCPVLHDRPGQKPQTPLKWSDSVDFLSVVFDSSLYCCFCSRFCSVEKSLCTDMLQIWIFGCC
jgi:hypothetical protein